LPPHWKFDNPPNEHVALPIEMLYYSQIMTKYKDTFKDPTALLLHCLVCIMHHSGSILVTMVANPGHDLSNILILHYQDLLCDLRPLVTTYLMPEVMMMSNGIPSHIELASQLKEILNQVFKMVSSFRDQAAQITETVTTTIDKNS
jgi:hypothetical protein